MFLSIKLHVCPAADLGCRYTCVFIINTLPVSSLVISLRTVSQSIQYFLAQQREVLRGHICCGWLSCRRARTLVLCCSVGWVLWREVCGGGVLYSSIVLVQAPHAHLEAQETLPSSCSQRERASKMVSAVVGTKDACCGVRQSCPEGGVSELALRGIQATEHQVTWGPEPCRRGVVLPT